MIYADYARRKMHNAVKLGNAEGYPLVINNAEGKKLKDYTIEGNTEYGENLFDYDTKANGFTVDKDGWMTTTLDNTTGTNVKYRWVSDKPCTLIKPDTNYYIYTQIETFDVESTPTASDTGCYLYAKSEPNATAANSQFVLPSLRYKAAGIYKATITSRSDFSGCTNMLRTFLNAPPGVKITVKFRIAVYEAEKDVFLPYTKTSVGDMTDNLLPYPYENTTITKNGITFTDNGDGSITVNGTATSKSTIRLREMQKTSFDMTKTYILSGGGNQLCYLAADFYYGATWSKLVYTTSNGDIILDFPNIDVRWNKVNINILVVSGSTINNMIFKPMLEIGETASGFEPYGKYKIPILINGENNTTIYLNSPLAGGESINYKTDNLPDIVLNKGTNTITTVKPKKISAKYYKTNCGNRVKEYGVRWNGTASTLCDRLGNAVGLVANSHRGTTDYVQNDFDSIYPWSDIKTCNIDDSGNVTAYIGDATFKRDGSNGDVMVEIPKFYYKRVKTGIVEEVWICEKQLPGYELHPLFIDNGKKVSKVFHSVYNASSFTDETDNKVKLQSITGVQPRVRTTRANFRTYARNKGAIWGIEDLSCTSALQMLYLVEYANTNSQAALGEGACRLQHTTNHKALVATTNENTITISSAYKNAYKLGQRIEIGTSLGANNKATTPRTITAISTDDEAGQTTITFDGDAISVAVGDIVWNVAPLNGSCDALNGKSGWLAGINNYTNGYADVNYRGIEGFHAKLFRFIDGVNIKDRVVYYANSMSDYADGVYNGKYRAVGYTNAEANGYVSAFGYDEKAPWVMFPTATGGSSSTYVPDCYYQNTGVRLPLLGGYRDTAAYAGAFSLPCNNAFSHSSFLCGEHLLVKKP